MATNEIHKYGDWLTVPVPEAAVPGDPIVFGDASGIPGVIQTMYQADLPDLPGYITIPRVPNGNETGEEIDETLMPAGMVFGSVAFRGVWAFEIEGAETAAIGAAVYLTGTDLVLGSGDAFFGHVTNRGTDGRLHVRLAAVSS